MLIVVAAVTPSLLALSVTIVMALYLWPGVTSAACVAIASAAFLIAVHEAGHAAVAIRNNIPVRNLSVGLPPFVVRTTIRGITYRVGVLPIGGFVTVGSDDDYEVAPRHAGRWARMSLAGAGANMLLGMLLLLIAMAVPSADLTGRAVVHEVSPDGVAAEAGLQPGDVIIQVETTLTPTLFDAQRALVPLMASRDTVPITVLRNDEVHQVQFWKQPPDLPIGATITSECEPAAAQPCTPLTAPVGYSVGQRLVQAKTVAESVFNSTSLSRRSDLHQGKAVPWGDRADSPWAAGPVTIILSLGAIALTGQLSLILVALASLSIGIGLTNLLPIPPLDGWDAARYGWRALRHSEREWRPESEPVTEPEPAPPPEPGGGIVTWRNLRSAVPLVLGAAFLLSVVASDACTVLDSVRGG